MIFILIIQILFCSMIDADELHRIRYRRDIGGESLDTSNFVVTIDSNGSRFVEVPQEYMINWLDDQIMWRTWSIILGLLCVILFGTLLFFLIYGFCTSTGPFADCIRSSGESSSDIKLTTSEATVPIDEIPKITDVSLPKTPLRTAPRPIIPLKTTGPLYLK